MGIDGWFRKASFEGIGMLNTDRTIVAISSAAGAGARSIVRLTGPDAIHIAQQVFRSETLLSDNKGFTHHPGMVHTETIELPARAYLFRGPRSYTRQDLVELHFPGNPLVATGVVEAILANGAEQAGPGEFTARAFFSGRLDLSEAQAVADLINAADTAHLRSAVANLGGKVHRICSNLASRITSELAIIEASIDLAEEDISLDTPAAVAGRLLAIAADTDTLAKDAIDMPESAHQPTVVLAGKPNAGKSALLNALSGEDRAIVSALAGTTRDVLSAQMTLAGVEIELLDAAGIGRTDDPLASSADSAARQAVARADILCFVIDQSDADPIGNADLLGDLRAMNPGAPVLTLANKIDLPAPANANILTDAIQTSATTGAGLDALRVALAEMLHLSAPRSGELLGLHRRQRRCLLGASDATRQAATQLAADTDLADQAEIVAIDLREALAQLGRISGQVVTDDILSDIFSRFCVGK
jgi:tRNA modification GTPase